MKAHRTKFYLLLIFLLIFGFGASVQAQTGLVYGDRIFGEITGAQPQVFYTFGGTTGDWVNIRVIGASNGMMPTLGLNAPTGQQVGFNISDDFDVVAGTARISYLVEETGVYTLQVGALADAQGGFLLVLDGQSATTIPVLSDVGTTTLVLPDQPQVFGINANPDAPITLNIGGEGAYVIKLINPAGEYIAIVQSGMLAGTALSISAGTGQYLVVLDASEESNVSLGFGGTLPTGGDATAPSATEEVTTDAGPPAGICSVTSTGAVNIRSGAGTAFDAFATLGVGTYYEVTGRTASNWYQIAVNGSTGYVFADVVVVNGPCDNLATVTGPQAPTAPTPVPPSATEETNNDTGNTGGGEQPTATEVTVVQEAPADTQYNNMFVHRDNGGSLSQVVSYPGGDTEDWIVANVNVTSDPDERVRTVDYTLTCSGTGTENIRFTQGARNASPQYGCGDTIGYRHEWADRTGTELFVTFADGSPASYVTYTITAVITGDR